MEKLLRRVTGAGSEADQGRGPGGESPGPDQRLTRGEALAASQWGQTANDMHGYCFFEETKKQEGKYDEAGG